MQSNNIAGGYIAYTRSSSIQIEIVVEFDVAILKQWLLCEIGEERVSHDDVAYTKKIFLDAIVDEITRHGSAQILLPTRPVSLYSDHQLLQLSHIWNRIFPEIKEPKMGIKVNRNMSLGDITAGLFYACAHNPTETSSIETLSNDDILLLAIRSYVLDGEYTIDDYEGLTQEEYDDCESLVETRFSYLNPSRKWNVYTVEDI